MITRLILFFVVSLSCLRAAPVRDGFLGIALAVGAQGGTSKVANTSSEKRQVKLPVVFVGAAEEYDLLTEMTLLSDIIQVGNYYSNQRDFLTGGQVYGYSFLNFSLQYRMWQYKELTFMAGFGLGHQGYLSPQFSELTYTIYAAPVASLYWFFSKNLALSLQAQLQVGLYRKNTKSALHSISRLELIFDPLGPVENPSPDSAYYSIGVQVDAANFKTNLDQAVSVFHWQPFAKFTLLY